MLNLLWVIFLYVKRLYGVFIGCTRYHIPKCEDTDSDDRAKQQNSCDIHVISIQFEIIILKLRAAFGPMFNLSFWARYFYLCK